MFKETEAFELVFVNDYSKYEYMIDFLDAVELCIEEMNKNYKENNIDQKIDFSDIHFNVILQSQLREREIQRESLKQC